MSGFLINLEGGEGCGKTSLMPDLVKSLRERGLLVFPTREPGGNRISELIRDILHDKKNSDMHKRAETLLYQASRAQTVERVIKPALRDGKIVLMDRFFDSTIAYQGFGRGQDIREINRLISYATGGLTPDLTVLLDVDVEVGLGRKKKENEWNRMDALPEDFHRRVREGYLKMASIDARWVVINANNKIEEVRYDLINEVTKRLFFVGLLEGIRKNVER